MKSAWIGSGFSHHSVPSLSKTATRSSSGTASDTVRSTNSTIARFAAPSFHLDNDRGIVYWIAIATRRRSASLMRWSWSSSPASSCTHLILPLKCPSLLV
jgi:hypothetical protein